jgi:hypothetical protein
VSQTRQDLNQEPKYLCVGEEGVMFVSITNQNVHLSILAIEEFWKGIAVEIRKRLLSMQNP